MLSPQVAEKMLGKRYGEAAMKDYQAKRESTRQQANDYDDKASKGDLQVIYRFGEDMIDESKIELNDQSLAMPGFKHKIELPQDNPFKDMF